MVQAGAHMVQVLIGTPASASSWTSGAMKMLPALWPATWISTPCCASSCT